MLAVMLALAGAIVAWMLLIQPVRDPVFLTIPVTEYTARHFPVNSLAEQDSDALLAHFPKGKKAFQSQERHLLLKELDALQAAAADEAVVVHLRAHAVNRDGELCLLPGKADPDNPDTWLPLDQVLESFRRCPSRHKLLILDAARPIADSRLGVLANDSADRLQDFLEKREQEGELPFGVLCACGRGQVSLVSEDVRQSVFGYYLDEGLRGHADGYNPEGKRDGRVTVRELAAFVKARVDRWAVRNRNTRQVPVLLGRGEDFPLTALEHGEAKPAREPAAVEPYPAWLRAGWELRDQWWADETFRAVPRAFRQLEATLLRAEQRWRGGIDAGRIQAELTADLDGFKEQAKRARLVIPAEPRPRALAWFRSRGLKPDPAVGAALRAVLAKADLVPAPKPEEMAKAKQEFLDKFKGKAPFVELAASAFEAALENPRPERVRLLHDLLQSFQPSPPFAETLYLGQLAEWKLDAKRWPVTSVQRALRIAREAEKAAASDPRAFPWVRDSLTAAANKRREGESLLFGPDQKSRAEADRLLEEAERSYQAIHRTAEVVQEAHRYLDTALALLPGYVSYLLDKPEIDRSHEKDWAGAARSARDLYDLLQPEPTPSTSAGSPAPITDLQKSLGDLQFHLNNLRRGFRYGHAGARLEPVSGIHAMDKMIREHKPSPRDYLGIQALLESPHLTAKGRETVLLAGRELSRRLHEETLATDREENDAKQRTAASPAGDGSAEGGSGSAAQRSTLRASLAIDLLKLGGLAGVEKLEQDLRQATRDPGEAALTSLAGKLRDAWGKRLPEQLRPLLNKPDWKAADRLSRALHPFDPDVKSDPAAANPTIQLRRQETLAFWRWLGDHYRTESRAPTASPARRAFYAEAAEEYLRLAQESNSTSRGSN